ncbi:hypothetical protein ATERTT37_006811 [Aspergillus terreus]
MRPIHARGENVEDVLREAEAAELEKSQDQEEEPEVDSKDAMEADVEPPATAPQTSHLTAPQCCLPSFSPVYFEAADHAAGGLFPKMWYLDDCHTVAAQNVGLMDILLAAYGPQMAHLGPSHTLALSSIDASIKSTVLEICGAGLSNRQSPIALLTASIAIAICGEWFTNRPEQQALMSILVSMSQDNNYWLSQAMQERLKRTWAWGCVISQGNTVRHVLTVLEPYYEESNLRFETTQNE